MQDLVARHKKEARELVNQTTALKKLATKGEKKKKKEILKQIEDLEKEMKERHVRELAEVDVSEDQEKDQEMQNKNEVEENDNEEGDLAAQLLAQIELEKKEKEKEKEDSMDIPNKSQTEQEQPNPKKRNRRKEKLAKRQEEIRSISAQAALEAAEQPDLRKIEMDNIEALCKIQKVVPHIVNADGHCLYASIADQLKQRHQLDRTILQLRTDAANHIRQDPDTFSPFLFDEDTMTMKDIGPYCDELEHSAVWGGDMEVLALAKVYDCPISTMFSGRPVMRVNESGSKPELKLVYYKHSFGLGEHYNSLREDK